MKDDRISHYVILDKLGEGGMGVVYKARDTNLGRTVAIKFLPSELTRNEKSKQRFIQEAQAASTIDHPNICTIYEVDETDDGRLFLCMAHYEGVTLKERIEEEGTLDQQEAVDIAIQVAEGLKTAHTHGIVHRDIKPANIFLTAEGKVKILDFGLAKLAGRLKLTTTGKAMGTVSYMSPEQGRGEEVGKETDIWALGVVLFEMVTGQLPFRGEYDVAVMYSILNEEPEAVTGIRPDVSPELEHIIRKAISKKKDERYADIDEMIADLKRFHRRIESDELSATYSWGRPGIRNRYLIPLAALTLLAVTVLIVQLMRRGPGDEHTRFARLPGRPIKITTGNARDSEPALSPEGGRIAYTADSQGNKDIFIIDVKSGNILQLTDDPGDDYYPCWFPDGNSLAFVSYRSGVPSIWKTSQFGGGATLIRSNSVDPGVSPDGQRIAFAVPGETDDLRIAVASLSDPADAVVLTGEGDGIWSHRRPAWSPDGSRICYSARHDLWLVPSGGGEAVRLTEDDEYDLDPAWSSSGEFIYFTSSREGTIALWRVDPRNAVAERLTMGTGFEQNPSVCESGACLAYSTETAYNEKYIRNMETGEEYRLGGTRYDLMADISPQGEIVVYTSDRGGPEIDLWVQRLRRGAPYGAPERLTETDGTASHPEFSPDGRWIAYYEILEDQREILIIPSSGGQPVMITDHKASDIHPAWSPDGRTMAFISQRGGRSSIWLVGIENGRRASDPVPVRGVEVGAFAPAWSPDGGEIAFVGVENGISDAWIVPVDGSSPARQLTSGADVIRIKWDRARGGMIASGSWGTEKYELRRLDAGGGMPGPMDPPMILGPDMSSALFNISFDGNILVYSKENIKGNIWILEGKEGDF